MINLNIIFIIYIYTYAHELTLTHYKILETLRPTNLIFLTGGLLLRGHLPRKYFPKLNSQENGIVIHSLYGSILYLFQRLFL